MAKKIILKKYQFINIIVELNWVIITDTNLSLFVDEFFKEFASYIIFFLIDFFLSYNQVKLDEKS